MNKRLRKVLSVALASAMTLGLVITGSGSGLKSVEAAMAVKQDSASEINYAAILGGAVDYGIVADSLIQQGHMESTFATNLYTTNANNDVDYQEKTAHFIIGGLSEGSKITLGKTTATSLYIEAPHKVFEGFDQSQITKDGTYGNFVFAEGFGKVVDGKYVYPPITEVKNQNASANVNRLVNRGAKMAEILAQKANDEDYVLSNEYIVDNGKLNINIDSPEFENKVVYIDMDSNMLKRLKDSSGVIINKKSSTVVVFNIDQDAVDTAYGTDPVETNKFEVYVNGIRHVSTTNPKGNKAGGYDDNDKSVTYVEDDKEICQKVIWNFNTTNDVNLSTFAGVMLAPKSNVTFTGGNVSGWLISGKEVNTNGIEFHYVYQGGSTDSYGQMHFSLIKSFTSEYANKDNVVADTSVDIKDGDFGFIWQEYEDDSYADNKKVGEPQEKEVKTDGTVQFPILSFYTGEDHTTDPHYVHKGSAEAPYNDETEDVYEKDPADPTSSGTFIETLYYNTEHFYFKIYEDETKTVPGISNSKGYITIDLKVRVDQYGHFTYVIDSVSKTGDNGEITYTVNDDVGMSGVQFDLGSFFNKTELGSIKLSKTFKFYDRYDYWSGWQEATTAPVLTHEQKEAIKYTITGPDGFSRVVNYSEFADDGTFTVTDIPIGGPYTITESGQDTANLIGDGYTYHPSTRQDSARSSSPTVTVNKVEKNEVSSAPEIRNSYVKLNDRSGTLVIKKKATKDGSAYSGKFNVAVKNNEGKYLQSMPVPVKDQYDQITGYNVDFSDTAKYFEIEAGGELEIVGLPSGSYKVYEKDVLKANTTVTVNGQSVTSDGEVEAGNVSLNADRKTFTINNDYVSDKGSLKVTKHFALDGANLPYVDDSSWKAIEFTITSVDDPSVTFTSTIDEHNFGNENYSVTFKDVPVGKYNVTETAIVSGSSIEATHISGHGEWDKVPLYYSTTTSEGDKDVTVTKGSTADSTIFTNNYTESLVPEKGKIIITKTIKGDVTEDEAEGALEFKITGPNGYTETVDLSKFDHVDGTKVYTYTLDQLDEGNYQVVESTKDITGKVVSVTYSVDGTEGTEGSDIAVADNTTKNVAFEDDYTNITGKIELTKTDEDSGLGINGATFELQDNNGTTIMGTSKHTLAGKITWDGLVYGKTYKVVETAPATGYDALTNPVIATIIISETTQGAIVSADGKVISFAASATNKKTEEPKGSLKITKALAAGSPAAASTKEYSFTVTGPSYPNGTTVKITGAASETLADIVPGNYTIVEDEAGAAIDGYALTVSGDNNKPVTVSKDATKEATITNTYTQDKGSLKITKALAAGSPAAASTKEYSFTVTGPSYPNGTTVKITGAASETLADIVPGNYTIVEDEAGAAIDGYALTVSGDNNKPVTVSKDATKEATITNTYTQDKGSLKITKALAAGSPAAASTKEYSFTVTGPSYPNGTTVKITGAASETLADIVPGNYTIVEDEAGAAIDGYALTVSGDNNKPVTVSKDATKEATITNTYTQDKGSLKITKALAAGSPAAASTKEYSFTVTGPSYPNGTTVKITGAASETLADIVPGNYTIVEDEAGAAIDGYALTVSGDNNKPVTVSKDATKEATITNTYTQDKGSLKITKALAAGSPAAASTKEYSFTVTGPSYPNGTTVKITGAASETLADIVPGNYTIVEDEAGAAIDGYALTVSGDNNKPVTVSKNSTKEATITNTYTQDKGSLKITKALAAGSPAAASTKEYSFTVTGPSYPNGTTVKITGAASETLADIVPGNYTIVEDEAGAAIDGYALTVSGDNNKPVTVSKDATKEATITNTYTQDKGSLKITKALAAGSPAAASTKEYSFTVTGPSYPNGTTVKITGAASETLADIVPGNYTIVEDEAGAAIDGYALTVSGDNNKPVTVSKDATKEATITNTYTQDKGSLKITKALAAGSPAAASTKEYSFTVTGPSYPNGTTVKITGAASETLADIVPGNYTIVEDEAGAAIDGYALTVSGDNNTPVTVAKNATKEAIITNTYTQNKGTLLLTKTIKGDLTADELAGALKFKVTAPDQTSVVYTIGQGDFQFNTTTKRYELTLSDIATGNYTVEETTTTKEGFEVTVKYSLNGESQKTGSSTTAEVKTGESTTVDFEDDFRKLVGDLKLSKAEATDSEGIPQGTKFGFNVTLSKTGTFTVKYSDSTEAQVIFTAGTATRIELGVGQSAEIVGIPEDTTYVVAENTTSLSDNYTCVSTVYSIDTDKKISDGDKDTVTVTNSYSTTKTDVTISKKETAGGNELPGAKLTLTSNDGKTIKIADIEKGTGASVISTADGSSVTIISGTGATTFKNLLDGSYTLHEEETPDSRHIQATDISFTISGGQITSSTVTPSGNTITMIDDVYGYLKVTKTLSGVTADQAKDITFKVTGPNNYEKTFKYSDIASTGYKVFDDVIVGQTYTVTESNTDIANKTTDTGYIVYTRDATEPLTYNVAIQTANKAEATPATADFVNKYTETTVTTVFDVYISKQAVGGGPELKGAELQITSEDGTVEYASWTSDGVTAKNVKLEAGTYVLTEIQAPNGYKVAESMKFTVEADGSVTVDGQTVGNNTVVMFDAPVPKKTVNFSKVDATNSKEIAGAELTLYSVDASGKLTKITNWTSSATEVYKFELTEGNYAIEETVAPEGYEKKTSLVKFSLTFDGNGNPTLKVTEGPGEYDATNDRIVFEDDPIKVSTGKLSVHVVEEKTGRDVPGAEVEVEYPDGTKKTFTTNDKGEIVDENGKTPIDVPAGEYKVTVTKVPEGYEVTTGETGTVTVPKDGEARHEAKIIPKTGGLTITVLEEGTNRVVPGATVEIEAPDGTTFPDGSKKITVITDENGKVTSYKDKNGNTIDLTTGLIPGDYKVTVVKVPEGYKVTTGETKTVTVKKGEVAEHIALIATDDTPATPTPSGGPNTPDSKTTPSPQSSSTAVNTGDSMNVVPVIIIMVIALAGIVFVIVRKRRSR